MASILFHSPKLFGQTGGDSLTGRADEIEAQRIQKATNTRPDVPTTIEKHFARMSHLIVRSPIRAGVGGLGPGAGFTVGSELAWYGPGDQVVAKLWGTASVHRFYTVGTGLELKKLTAQEMSFGLEAAHSDAPRLDYYGSGPDSSLQNRTDYRREDTVFGLHFETRPHARVRQRCRLGELLVNIGPGTNNDLASTESVFGPAEAPGIDVQPDFLIAGCSAEFDFRDFRDDPHKGTYAVATYDRYHAQGEPRFSFNRVSGTVEHYFPFLNRKRVIAVRARTELSLHSGDQVVPFYLQANLGGDANLRGFRRYRFYDENSVVFNAEYRWEINTGFDMAVFVDAGEVFHRPGGISWSGMEESYGFGFRFKGRRNLAARLDTGFSREGMHVWLKFGTLF